jgi:mRNA interferase MazF
MTKKNLSAGHHVLRGALYWLAPDPLKDSIQHPHVVLQDDIFNASRIPTTIICALSTNLQKAIEPGNVLLDEAEAGLPRRSVIVVSQLSVVNKLALQNYIGILASGRVVQVLAGLRFQQVGFLYAR